MDTFQIILILAGIGFGAYIYMNMEDKKKEEPKKNEDLVEVPLPQPNQVDDSKDAHTHNFMCLVQKWDVLRKCCHEQGLHEACDILNDQVFPLLNKYIKHEGEVKS